MIRKWIILGGGGHAGVVIDTLQMLGASILGFTDPLEKRRTILGVECMGTDEVVAAQDADNILLANGLGSTVSTERRAALFHRFASRGYVFEPIIHPSAVVAESAELGAGTQVMAGSILQTNCRLGENVLVNTRASVDHDCVIESDVHIAPGVTISGGVVIGRGAHIGTGANVIQGVRIGSHSVVGAGALVLQDVRPGTTMIGVPAKECHA